MLTIIVKVIESGHGHDLITTPEGPTRINHIRNSETVIQSGSLTFKHQHHKIIKHIQTIRWQIADELFECV